MEKSNTDLIEELSAKSQIRDALVRFCRGADRRDADLIRSAFHPDAYDDHGAYSGDVDGFINWQDERHRDIPQCMHMLGNCTIDLQDKIAFTETYCLATITEPSENGFCQTQIGCRYVDVFESRDEVWRIANRKVVYEFIKRCELSEIVPDGFDTGARSIADPSYLR